MQIKSYDRFGDVPLTPNHWNAMSRRNSTNTIFQTHEWSNAWWGVFGENHRCHFLTINDGDRITGLAPLMSRSDTLRDWRFLADSNSDYCDFSIDGNRYAVLDTLMRYFAREFRDWNSLTFRNIPEQSTTIASLETLCERYGLSIQMSGPIAAPEIAFGECRDGYKLKYSIRRHCNRLERIGKIEFRIIREESDLPGALDTLYRQHISRYRDKGECSLFENALCRVFYEDLARALINTGWLHFSQLLLDGNVIATHFGFEYDGVLTWYKPTFDLAYRHYSPGTVLIKNLIEYAENNHLKTLDFTIGDEDFKNRFSNATTYNRNVVIYKNKPSAYLHSLRTGMTWSAKQAISALRRPHAPGKRHHPNT